MCVLKAILHQGSYFFSDVILVSDYQSNGDNKTVLVISRNIFASSSKDATVFFIEELFCYVAS